MKPPVKFHWKGIHHSYYGILFGIIPGWILLWLNSGNNLDYINPIFWILIILGTLLVIDDLIEHTVTEDTPARIIWNKIKRK
jgi:hypothetical protein